MGKSPVLELISAVSKVLVNVLTTIAIAFAAMLALAIIASIVTSFATAGFSSAPLIGAASGAAVGFLSTRRKAPSPKNDAVQDPLDVRCSFCNVHHRDRCILVASDSARICEVCIATSYSVLVERGSEKENGAKSLRAAAQVFAENRLYFESAGCLAHIHDTDKTDDDALLEAIALSEAGCLVQAYELFMATPDGRTPLDENALDTLESLRRANNRVWFEHRSNHGDVDLHERITRRIVERAVTLPLTEAEKAHFPPFFFGTRVSVLVALARFAEAVDVWKELGDLQLMLPPRTHLSLIRALIELGRIEEARKEWSQLTLRKMGKRLSEEVAEVQFDANQV